MCAGTPTVINVSLLIYLLVNYYNTTVFDELDNKSLGTSDQWLIKKIERGGGGNVSASSSFIANAHNGLYAFYMGKCELLGGAFLESAPASDTSYMNENCSSSK